MDPALQMIIFAAAMDDGPSKHAGPAVSAAGRAGHVTDPHAFFITLGAVVFAALITFILFRDNK